MNAIKSIGAGVSSASGPVSSPSAEPRLVRLTPDRVEATRPRVAVAVRQTVAPSNNEARYRQALATYETAFARFDDEKAKPYWTRVQQLAQGRIGRRIDTLTDADFMNEAPPVYDGPKRPNPADFGLPVPPREPSTIAVVRDFIAAADRLGLRYDLLRENATSAQRTAFEARYKRRYAEVALRAGLTQEQILGVYAFETGGRGTHDMQAGIDPATGRGRQISTALGYAQLLAANSNTVFATHGELIASRLEAEGKPEKAALVRNLRQQVLAIHGRPPGWAEAQRIARTDLGRACHAANLDIDIGPHMQTVKLADTAQSYRDQARFNGMPEGPIPGDTLESMNLAGVVPGFQIAHPAVANRLTVNFFERDGYEANPVAGRGRTAAGLRQIMRDIMSGAATRSAGYRELKGYFEALE